MGIVVHSILERFLSRQIKIKVSAHEAEAWLARRAVGITRAPGASASLSAQIFTSVVYIRERVEEKVGIDDLSSPESSS